MIKIINKEYLEDNIAKREYSIKLFGYSLFHRIDTTANINTINLFKRKEVKHIKGFKN